ncbi:hypothetical protein Tco_0919587, partial [Tanacetum coccineum]
MLWGIVTQSNIDHAELLWEEFTQGIQTFFLHKASHKAGLKDPKKKVISPIHMEVLKRAPPKKPITTTPVKPTKPPLSKQPKSPTKKPSKRKLPQKVRKGKPSFQLVDEAQQESVSQGEGDDPALELAKKMSLDAHQEKGEGEGVDADIERAIKLSLDPFFLPQGRAPVGGVTIRDP